MPEFVMPKLGADMTAGTLVAWLKGPGDPVRRGETVAQVDTDKGVIDIEIFVTGVIDRVLVQPGEKVPVGTVLATVTEAAAGTVSAPQAAPHEPVGQVPPAATTPVAAAASKTGEAFPGYAGAIGSRLRISPAARRLARELHVDPATLKPTGPGGAVTREDIERAAAARASQAAPATAPAPAPSAAPAAAGADLGSRMRQAIAAAMARSKREIPHYYLATTIDLEPVVNWLAAENIQRPVTDRLLIGLLFIKAVALALREVPELNALWDGSRAEPSPAIHVGVAISLRQGGLVAPALHDTDRQSLGELMANFRDLVARARAGALRGSELSDPTITLTSLGDQGVETTFGIIYPPQVALVGFGKVVERPWSVGGQIVSRHVVQATLSADHRVTDGHRGAAFLALVDRLLQKPDKL